MASSKRKPPVAEVSPRRGRGGFRYDASPRYFRVYVTLRAWVRDSTYAPGQQIPTEPDLCKLFSVSRITIRRAIDQLVKEGWLIRQQGRGTFVDMSAARGAVRLDLAETIRQVADLGSTTEVADVQSTVMAADDETRAALELADDARVVRNRHVRMLNGVRLAWITTFTPMSVAMRLPAQGASNRPLLEQLPLAGIEPMEADQFVGATLASVEAARALHLEVGAPLLRITRVVFGARRRPLERVVALYRADAYQYRMHLAGVASQVSRGAHS
ncbi:MAG: GntR family transcriptional regulator [Steroidobacteraceae bacterium]